MKILAISSYVASGGVGLRQSFPVLEDDEFELIAQPTIVLSQHLGHDPIAGHAIPISDFTAMLTAMQATKALDHLDAILVGFLPTVDHVELVAGLISSRTLSAKSAVIVDPIFGDDPEGLYLPDTIPDSVRAKLLPVATIATPNRFELETLADCEVNDIPTAIKAAQQIDLPLVFGTSIPVDKRDHDKIATIAVTRTDCWIAIADRRQGVPHGTGDLFAALVTRLYTKGYSPDQILARAVGVLNTAIDRSLMKLDLLPATIQNIDEFSADAPIEHVKM